MRQVLISTLLAAAGLAVAWRLFPSVDAMGKYPAHLSREAAIAKARTIAESFGRTVEDWDASASSNVSDRTYEFLRTSRDHPMAHAVSPLEYTVVFARGPFLVSVRLTHTGAPAEFSFRDGRQPEFSPQPLSADDERDVLAAFAGVNQKHFRKVSSVSRAAQGHLTTWEWREEDEPDLILQLEVISAPDGVRSAAMRSEFSAAALQRWVATFGRSGTRFVMIPILMVLAITITNALFFAGLARGHIKLRPALRFFAGLMALWAVGYVAGIHLDRTFMDAASSGHPPPERLLRDLGLAVAMMPLFAAMWAVGRNMMRSSGLERWWTWDAVLDGDWWRSQVGNSVACGLLVGAALTALPLALCALHLFARTDLKMSWPPALAARVPAVLPISNLMPWDFAGIFFLLVPMACTRYGRRVIPPWVRWILVAGLSVVIVTMVSVLLVDSLGGYVVSGVLAAGFFAIYWWLDLTAVLVSSIGYSAASLAIYLLHQDSSELRASGLAVAALYGGLALAGVVAARWAPALEPVPEEQVVEIIAEREALESEFAMARAAQQRLLPRIPARVDGFSLSASCHPARDVGGDLYDFFRFPDGSYGMCVADVSGKGVPAALYMTMTKGILAAASRDPVDLPGLAAVLNAQLYAAGRKKTFVTMALARLDPSVRRLEYLRAGHNSILWRRSEAGSCEYRKPRGVGLGLAPSRLFDRAIQVDQLDLQPGDVVVFYSDGITEAMNTALELFGEERLEAVVQQHAGLDAAGIEAAILREVRSFAAGEPPHDDMTLLVLKA